MGDSLAATLEAQGVDVLIDDRAERPGFKFKDADLLGFPFRVTVGERGLANGIVELKRRGEADFAEVPVVEIGGAVLEAVRAAGA
ncbi:MAG: His/Gly/Thr/Pro-type tRNA ligase C-terminal domain-containing protein [Limnospira sp. PMC 1234.20]|nr:His/Gly/Thr/Pro-type tRNA ligase C-terminal domain-containing protein [Limnospira sp. PMC 1234.20]